MEDNELKEIKKESLREREILFLRYKEVKKGGELITFIISSSIMKKIL